MQIVIFRLDINFCQNLNNKKSGHFLNAIKIIVEKLCIVVLNVN